MDSNENTMGLLGGLLGTKGDDQGCLRGMVGLYYVKLMGANRESYGESCGYSNGSQRRVCGKCHGSVRDLVGV